MQTMNTLFVKLSKHLDNEMKLTILRQITQQLKCESNRKQLSETIQYWNILTQFIHQISDHFSDDNCESNLIVNQIITELFRLLRNSCVNCSRNQSLILSNESLFNDCGKLFKTISRFYLLSNGVINEELKCQLIATIKCCLQYFANLLAKTNDCQTTDRYENKLKVWQIFEFDLLWQLLIFDDKDVSITASAVFYNCVTDNDLIEISLSDTKFVAIIDALLCGIGDELSEWSLWSIELMLNVNDFLSHVFSNLSSKSKIILLDVIHETINDLKNIERVKLSESNLLYLVQFFKNIVVEVVSIDKSNTDTNNDDLSVIIAQKLLSVLCELSSNKQYLIQLQTDLELMKLLVNTLKSIHILGKTDSFSKFKPLNRLKLVSEDDVEAESPVFGFKKNLIRLIGNLSYECVAMQDSVRENEGIVVILDCCNIDASNPYIMEWSIFAIKNLMKLNADNQTLIYSLSKNGDLVKDELSAKLLCEEKHLFTKLDER